MKIFCILLLIVVPGTLSQSLPRDVRTAAKFKNSASAIALPLSLKQTSPLPASPVLLTPVVVEVDTLPVATTAEQFLGINIDTCDIAKTDFANPELIAAASRFAPTILRVGGSAANELFLNFSQHRPQQPWVPSDMAHSNTTLPGTVWDALYDFANATGLRLLWDLNVLGSRYASNNTWDPTNTMELFQHIATTRKRDPAVLAGFQFGNEPFLHDINKDGPSWVTGKQLADDFLLLQSMATQYNLSSFVLQAPDSCCAPFDRVLLEDFINTVSTTTAPSSSSSSSSGSRSALSQASFHLYSNPYSCSPAALIDSKHAEVTATQMQAYHDSIVKAGHRGPIVLSETAGHSVGGCVNVTDAFVSSLWFVDWLGTAARTQIAQVYRQKLVGDDKYDLITLPARNGDPPFHRNPDFYTSLLWRALVGARILSATVSTVLAATLPTMAAATMLRLTAACTPPGAAAGIAGIPQNAVVVVYSNWNAANVGNISFKVGSGSAGAAAYAGAATLFALESYPAGQLESNTMTLNGGVLTANSTLAGLAIPSFSSIAVPGYSLGFVVLNDAKCTPSERT